MDQTWIAMLPAILRGKLEGRHNFQKILANTGWLFVDKIVRMGIGLVVGVWIARYLGPTQFGAFNYIVAFIGIYDAIAGMGLNGIVVRDLINEPESVNITLGSAFVLQIIGSLIAIGLAIGSISLLRPDDKDVSSMVAILSLSLIFKSAEIIKYWFESQVQSRYSVWVENSVFIISSGIKVCMILLNAPLRVFLWMIIGESILVATGLFVMYARVGGHIRAWQPCLSRAKRQIADAWPLIISSIAIFIYMRIDQIMLGEMLGNESVGIYSAAVRISEVWYFIPMIIVSSVFPSIIEAKNHSEDLYYYRLQKLYDCMMLISLSMSVIMSFLSSALINTLYGAAYHKAYDVLIIHIWSGIFVSLGVARGKWLLVENITKYSFVYTGLGAVLNIVCNYIFIPRYGVTGAAFATLISYGASVIIVPAFFRKTRISTFQLIKSFNILRLLLVQRTDR